MVQRRTARYATNRFHNTSSVTEILGDLGWETFQSRRTKANLTMFYKIENELVDIRMQDYVQKGTTSTGGNCKKYRKNCHKTRLLPTVFSPALSLYGTLCQPPQSRLPAWYPSSVRSSTSSNPHLCRPLPPPFFPQ